LSLLPPGHGQATFRVDSAYYNRELLAALRAEGARFTVSLPRNQAVRQAAAAIPEQGWQAAREMAGAEVAETSYTPTGWEGEPLRLIVRRLPFAAAEIAAASLTARRRKTIPPEQLALALDGETASVFGYSFILTDIPDQDAVAVEHFHRHRAQIEERLKEAKLGQALRHLPSGNQDANRVWLSAALIAVNLSAFCCDLCPAAGASGGAHAAAAALLRPRPHRPKRQTADPPPPRRLPPRRDVQRHTRRRLRAPTLRAAPTRPPPPPPAANATPGAPRRRRQQRRGRLHTTRTRPPSQPKPTHQTQPPPSPPPPTTQAAARVSDFPCRRGGSGSRYSGSRSPKWILNASRAVVQLRVRVHAGTALTMAR
jgi:Transposase DDE domain group 1